MDSLAVQYLIVAVLILFALYSVFKKLKGQFSKDKNKNGCDTDCGCS